MPVWAPDSRELFYIGGELGAGFGLVTNNPLMVVSVDSTQKNPFVPPSILIERGFLPYVPAAYDAADDGRFVTVEVVGHPDERSINVVQNWFEELKQRAPRGD